MFLEDKEDEINNKKEGKFSKQFLTSFTSKMTKLATSTFSVAAGDKKKDV